VVPLPQVDPGPFMLLVRALHGAPLVRPRLPTRDEGGLSFSPTHSSDFARPKTPLHPHMFNSAPPPSPFPV
jgi:hypothetical protein